MGLLIGDAFLLLFVPVHRSADRGGFVFSVVALRSLRHFLFGALMEKLHAFVCCRRLIASWSVGTDANGWLVGFLSALVEVKLYWRKIDRVWGSQRRERACTAREQRGQGKIR